MEFSQRSLVEIDACNSKATRKACESQSSPIRGGCLVGCIIAQVSGLSLDAMSP